MNEHYICRLKKPSPACNYKPAKCSFGACSAPLKTPCTANLQQVSVTSTCTVTCKFCGSKNVVKYGKMHNRQYYLCHDCNRTFAGNDALPGMRYTPEQIATALNLFYEGLSIDKIRREVDNQYHLYPSDSTVYEWVVRFSKQAVNEAKISDVKVGDFWVADETMLPIGGENTWFWDIIDEKTRFLLSSRISRSRTKQDAQILIDRAIKTAGKNPQVVITDRLASYLDIRYGKGAEHVQGSPFTSKDSTNLIERFHGTLKSRTEVMRGMKNIETARIIMDGWLIYYNFFRPHESLNNKTPAEMARASFPYKNWHEVVMQGGERSNVCSSK